MIRERRKDVLALALLTSIITVLFIDVLAGANVLYLRDLLHYHYPHKKILREVVLSGEFPYWNRVTSAGQPMAANPAHEVFYPLTWLILLPSYDYGFQLFIVIHLYIAAWAMYALLRSLAIGPAASFFGALSFALGGIVLSYMTLLPFLAGVVWLPAVCLFARRFLLERRGRDFALAAIFLAMQIIVGEPTSLPQTGMLMGMYAIYSGIRRGGARAALRNVAFVGAISIAALFVSAVALLPGLDHARESVRARGFDLITVTNWSMPLVRPLELIYPNILGHAMMNERRVYWAASLYPDRRAPFVPSIYAGLFITAFAIAGVFARVRGWVLFLIIALLSYLLAIGSNTPLWQWLYETGLVRSLRYPEKFVLMGWVSMIVFGARALDVVLAGDERTRRIAFRVLAVVTIVATVCAIIALTPWHARIFFAIWNPPTRLFTEMLALARSGWILAAARGLLLLVLIRTLTRTRPAVWLGIAGTFVVLDLATPLPEMAARTSASYLKTPPPVLRLLPPNRDQYRLFHHAALHRSRPQVAVYYRPDPDVYAIYRHAALPMIPAAHGVQTVMEIDYDLTALLCTTDFLESVWTLADRTPRWLETAVSMSNVWYRAVYRDPDVAFALAKGDRRLVQPVVIVRHPRYPRYSFARRVESIRDKKDFVDKVATDRFPLGTAYVYGPSFTPAPGVVRHFRETANTARIDVETAGRAFLYMSVTPHKYWTVTIDGAEAEPVVTNVGYQGVVIPTAGRHVVEMRYRNPLIAAGAAISLAALLALAITMRAL